MVDKMIKYSFILLSEETDGFLDKLQELGVVDVTRSAKPIDDRSAAILESVGNARRMIAKLEGIDYSKDEDKKAIDQAYGKTIVEKDMVEGAGKAFVRLMELEAEKTAAEKEVKTRLPWGDFDKARLQQLETLGYAVRYYKTDRKAFDAQWSELYPLQIISEDKSVIWFVTVCPKDQEYSMPIEQAPAPEGSWKEAQAKAEALKAEIAKVKGQLLRYKENIAQMKKDYQNSLTDLDLYLAKASTESAAEDMLSILEGFAPAELEDKVSKALDKMGVLYIKEEAREEDNPPIKLKNNKFVKMFESITGMYGMPNYGEYDPTPVVSIFFLLFFALCMGDAGYGLVLILVGLAINKGWLNIGMFKGLGGLIATLGVATAVVGTALGTFFGMSILDLVPETGAWTGVRSYFTFVGGTIATPMGELPFQMLLALGIGVFHLCLAMTIKAVGYTRRLGFKENISTWGWLILILGGIIVGTLGLVDVMGSDITKISIIVIGVVSALGIFIFNTPGRNPLINIGAGLWDTYNMVTGIMGDVLSYIRLYALGLAGGMLGAAFNDLGLMVRGTGDDASITGWVFFIIILLIGHVLNLLMSCLGAFVHPLRLNFVEYFKNSGFEGKGKKYSPLTKENKED
ncbi:MAG: ATPase V [Bacteroidales bacterium]|nr:ATPase V [Bacteroidales bacterium]